MGNDDYFINLNAATGEIFSYDVLDGKDVKFAFMVLGFYSYFDLIRSNFGLDQYVDLRIPSTMADSVTLAPCGAKAEWISDKSLKIIGSLWHKALLT